MKLGVFIPIGNNGWLISTTSPQYMPSFDLNRTIVEKAERFGFDFALSMIKLHGYGGRRSIGITTSNPSRSWPGWRRSLPASSSSPPAPC